MESDTITLNHGPLAEMSRMALKRERVDFHSLHRSANGLP